MAQKIGDLFFELGLDDKKLKSQWDSALKKYEQKTLNLKVQLDSKSLSKVQDQLNKLNLSSFAGKVKEMNQAMTAFVSSANRLSSVKNYFDSIAKSAGVINGNLREMPRDIENANRVIVTQKGLIGELTSYARRYVSIWGAASIAKSIIRITGEIEYQRRALESVMQNAEKANEIWGQIQQLAVKSPFQVGDLLKYTKQLSAFGIENEHLFDTLKRLADVSAGLGVDLSRIALAYGEINAATVLRGKETRQLTQAGIPIIRELAKAFSDLEGRIVSAGEVYKKIFSRQVSFDMVKKVFEDLTNEGGKFYQMQEKQAATLKGSIKNIADQWTLMANAIGESQSGWMKDFVTGLKSVMANWQSWIGAVKTGISVFIRLKIIGSVATSIQNLAASLKGATSAAMTFGAAVNSIAGIVGILAIAINLLFQYKSVLSDTQMIIKAVMDAEDAWRVKEIEVTNQLDLLYLKLKLAKKGTEEYEEARQTIIRSYPEYFDRLRAEGKEVGDLTQHYEALKKEALAAANARIMADAQTEVLNEFNEAVGGLVKPSAIRKAFTPASIAAFDNKTVAAVFGALGGAESRTSLLNDKQVEIIGRLVSGENLNPADYWNDLWFTGANSVLNGYLEWYLKKNGAKYKELAGVRDRALEDIEKRTLPFMFSGGADIPTFKEGAWQLSVRDILKKYGFEDEGSAGNLWVSESSNITDYEETLKKTLKALEKDYKNFVNNPTAGDAAQTKARIDAIKDIAKDLKFDLSDKSGEGNKEKEKEIRDSIRVIDEQLQWVEKIREFYRQLKELGFSPKEAQELLRGIYKGANLPKGYTLDDVFNSDYGAVLEMFKNLYTAIGGADAMKASENMQQKIAQHQAKELVDSLKLAKKIEDDLKEWGAQDFVIEGEGGLGKLSKLMSDLQTKQNKAALKYQDLLAQNELTKDTEGYERRKALIEELYELQKKYNVDLAQQSVDSFGEAFAKKATKELNVAFKNAGKKSLADLEDALEKFAKTKSLDFGIFDEGAKAIIKGSEKIKVGANGEIDWNSLGGLSEEEFSDLLESSGLTDTERESLSVLYKTAKQGENIQKLLESIAHWLGIEYDSAKSVVNEQKKNRVINPLFDSLSQIGGAIGGTTGNVISNIAGLGKTAATLYSNYKAGKGATTAEYISMGIQGLVGAYSAISGIIKKNKQTMREWKDAIMEATQAARMNVIEQKAYKQSNVWGVESPYKRIQAAAAQYVESQKQLNKAAQDLIEKGKYKKGIKKVMDADTTVGITAGTTVAGAAAGTIIGSMASGAAAGSIVPGYGTLIGAAVGLVAGIITSIFSKKKTPKYKQLTDIYGSGNIYDPKTFELNQQIINDYAKMNDETKKLIDNWEEIKDKLKEAKEEMEDQTSELTGNLGDDIKDMLVRAFSDGDIYAAIDDIDEYLGNLIKNLAIQSAYAAMFENVFNTLQDRMMKSFNGDQEITDDILWLRGELPKYVKGFGQVLEVLQDELDKVGIDTDLTGGGSTSSSAISGVTEEMASRFLGQINAIRADVSVKRAILEAYLPHIGTINDTMAGGLATLKEIEVNTRRGADITGEIRDLIDSMMGVSNTGAGYALNVNIG